MLCERWKVDYGYLKISSSPSSSLSSTGVKGTIGLSTGLMVAFETRLGLMMSSGVSEVRLGCDANVASEGRLGLDAMVDSLNLHSMLSL